MAEGDVTIIRKKTSLANNNVKDLACDVIRNADPNVVVNQAGNAINNLTTIGNGILTLLQSKDALRQSEVALQTAIVNAKKEIELADKDLEKTIAALGKSREDRECKMKYIADLSSKLGKIIDQVTALDITRTDLTENQVSLACILLDTANKHLDALSGIIL